MNEIREKRSLTSKTFDNNDGSLKLEAHIGHIHYNNKLGVGDGVKGLRSIDWDLQWDDVRKGWYFEHHSFNPFIPEYSDGWIEFRDLFEGKDQIIKYKAQCQHIKGKLVKPDKDDKISPTNYVIYENAFGEGIDYILYFTRSRLVKAVRIKDEVKEIKDYEFDFEVEFPKEDGTELEVKRHKMKVEKSKVVDDEYLLDLTKRKVFNSERKTKVGNDKKDGKEWHTYLMPFQVWDDVKRKNIEVEYYIKDGKKFLKKKISKDFIEFSIGDVLTDTTTSYYSGAGDGYVGHNDTTTSWDTAHDATSGTYVTYTDTVLGTDQVIDNSSGKLTIKRHFIPIDTSGLPDGAVISAASLYLYIAATSHTLDEGYDYWMLVQTSQADETELAVADYNQCGAVNNPDLGATQWDISAITTGQYSSIALDSTGRGWISKTGYTKLGGRIKHDTADEPFTKQDDDRYTGLGWRTSEYTGTDSDPYLSVTYSIVTTTVSLTPNTFTASNINVSVAGAAKTVLSAISATFSNISATITGKAKVVLGVITATFTNPEVLVTLGKTVVLNAVAATFSNISPLIKHGQKLIQSVQVFTTNVISPTVKGKAKVILNAITGTFSVITTGIVISIIASLSAITSSFTIPTVIAKGKTKVIQSVQSIKSNIISPLVKVSQKLAMGVQSLTLTLISPVMAFWTFIKKNTNCSWTFKNKS